jgi:threonine synthase
MRYISTRGNISPIPFQEAIMMGLADDGGLLLPESIPTIDPVQLSGWRSLSYQYLATEILGRFIDDIPRHELHELIENAYSRFSHPQITPVSKRGDLYILELYHGPTLAFKDVALQLLGNLFEYVLQRQDRCLNILGATSGDTGSAAISGVRGKERINIFILHPHGRTSPIQALQMTTVLDDNVFNIAVNGTFDDSQAIVKGIFGDLEFKKQYNLGAINSINWARVLAQVVYYIYAWLKFDRMGESSIDFSIPTGNFGDIFAGFVAKRMLPPGAINRLVLATNENDILSRFVAKGDYSKSTVVPTFSPSMDIQVASNFERYLYYLRGEDPQQVKTDMATFADKGNLDLSALKAEVDQDFATRSVSEEETIAIIGDFHKETGFLLDPHTAVGVKAAQTCKEERPMVCLATAHPAKFGEAVEKAIGTPPDLPPALAALEGQETRCANMEADAEPVKQFIRDNAIKG